MSDTRIDARLVGARPALALIVLAVLAAPAASQTDAHGASPAQAMVIHDEGYVGSDACRECHAENHASWHASFHRTMTQEPRAGSVLAPFNGTTPVLEGVAWKLASEDDAFFATPVGPTGAALGPRARVAITTGAHHFQVYWLTMPGGTLEQMPLLWDVIDGRWVPRKSTFLSPPGPSGSEKDRWQQVCIKCHTTNGTPDHPANDATRVAELGIACEACHGPGEAHVAWRRKPESKEREESGTGLVDPSELEPALAAQVCGQCHGTYVFADSSAHEAWMTGGFAYRPGADLAQTRTLLHGRAEQNSAAVRAYLARTPGDIEQYFWSDGQVRVSGREYNGLVESPCYAKGTGERRMTCLSCHELHVAPERVAAGWPSDQLKPGMDGPAACLACHADFADEAKQRAHTHHAPGSSGNDCLNCHMPYTTYGLTKAIRSHTITSPKVADSLATGRPNACNQCHLDRSLGWAAEKLTEWYGAPAPELDADQRTIAASVLWSLEGDAGQRALMAWSLGWAPARSVAGTEWSAYLVSTLLLDEYDAVRWIAMRTARLDPRWKGFTLDLCAELEEQRNHVRETVLTDWLAAGLKARDDQRAAVLVQPDGKLDQATFRRLYAKRDNKPMSLAE